MEPINNFLRDKKNYRQFTEEQTRAAKRLKHVQMARQINADPDYPYCGGEGHLRRDNGTGVADPCPCRMHKALAYSPRYGISEEEAKKVKWDGLVEVNNVWLAKKAILAAFEQGGGWIYLYGNYGTGKSTIMKRAVANFLHQGIEAVYIHCFPTS